MNMYLHELKAYRKLTLIWILALVGSLVLFLSFFPSLARDAVSYKQLLEGYPEELKKAIGLSVDSLTTILGFYAYVFVYIKLGGAIQAMTLGLSIISKETRGKTADFLLTKPITRTQIMTAKLLATVTLLVMTNVIFSSATIWITSLVTENQYNMKRLLMLSITLFFIQLIFLALGVMVAILFPKIKSVISVSLGIVFAFFMMNMISSSTDDPVLRYFTPFHYVDSMYIMNHGAYEGVVYFYRCNRHDYSYCYKLYRFSYKRSKLKLHRGVEDMNMFWREMKSNRTSLILWCIGVLFMVGVGMGKYTLSTATTSLNDVMAGMPKSLQAIMGTNSLDLSSVIGYYGLLYLYLVVMAAIHASMLGATIISKEETDKTAEFLLVKPISRSQIITAKFMAAFIHIGLFNAVTFLFSMIMVQKYAEGEDVIGAIAIMMLGMLILQVLYVVMGTAVATMMKNAKIAPAVSTGILLSTFILSMIINLNSKLENLKYFTPFKYFEAQHLISDGFEAIYVMVSIALIIGFLIVTYLFYNKRDLDL